MGDNDENANLIYETNAKGEQVLVRSFASDQTVFIRFVNRISRPVDVWWRDFAGRRQHYIRMVPFSYYDVTTYITHPWEFTDPATKENYHINSKIIFRAPEALAGVRQRSVWIISVCIRSLRKTVMLSIAQRLKDPSKVPALGLPRELANDLGQLINAIENTPPPPPRP